MIVFSSYESAGLLTSVVAAVVVVVVVVVSIVTTVVVVVVVSAIATDGETLAVVLSTTLGDRHQNRLVVG